MSMMAKLNKEILKNKYSTGSIWESCIYDMLNTTYDKPCKEFFESNLLSFNKHLDADFFCIEIYTNNKDAADVVCCCNRTETLPPSTFHGIGTLRERALTEHIITITKNVRDTYPNTPFLSKLNIQAFSSITLFDPEDKPIGVLTALFCDKIKDDKKVEALLFIFSNTMDKYIERARERKLEERKNAALLLFKEELERTNKQLVTLKKELEIANLKAKEAQQLKTTFLANLSHEIRTPMNAILGFTELLKSDDLNKEEKSEYLDIVLQNGGLLLRVMDDLIEISKLQTEQGFAKKERVSVNNLILDLHHNYTRKITATQKPLELILILGNPDGKDNLLTHKEALYKSLNHLIDNAVKFTKEGSIYIGYTVEKGVFEFFVKDSGIGIPKDKKESIFDLFRQLDNSMSRKFGGNGVGLPIAKKYVEIMGGEIWAEPDQALGALFKMVIPAG